jgi:glucokinase
MDYAVGIDIGGTNIKAGVVSEDGRVIAQWAELTEHKDKDTLIKQITKIVENFKKKYVIKGVGIGVAGLVDYEEGVVRVSPHLPLKNIPLRSILTDQLGLPVSVDNDANAGGLGERYYGMGRTTPNFVFLTLGTGIGGAVFINGELIRGTKGFAGELGHMIIDINGPQCKCGARGCLEALASGSAIEKIAGTGASEVTKAASAGEDKAKEILTSIGKKLGIGIANILNILDPELIIVGGKVSQAGALILNPAIQVAMTQALAYGSRKTSIKISTLGDEAGILGTATLVFQDKI